MRWWWDGWRAAQVAKHHWKLHLLDSLPRGNALHMCFYRSDILSNEGVASLWDWSNGFWFLCEGDGREVRILESAPYLCITCSTCPCSMYFWRLRHSSDEAGPDGQTLPSSIFSPIGEHNTEHGNSLWATRHFIIMYWVQPSYSVYLLENIPINFDLPPHCWQARILVSYLLW